MSEKFHCHTCLANLSDNFENFKHSSHEQPSHAPGRVVHSLQFPHARLEDHVDVSEAEEHDEDGDGEPREDVDDRDDRENDRK